MDDSPSFEEAMADLREGMAEWCYFWTLEERAVTTLRDHIHDPVMRAHLAHCMFGRGWVDVFAKYGAA
jgi:hypothetical protein